MHEFRADLHCHTTCSDGSLSPKELILHAKEIGLAGLSITDHDTIVAYETAIDVAKEVGVLLGSGVEFSSVDQGINVHILGYDIDLQNPKLKVFCEKHLQRRFDRILKILKKLETKGFPLDSEELKIQAFQGHPVGRPHIAAAMVAKGYVVSIQEAFNRFLGDNMPCFDPGVPVSTLETIEVIHQAGGKAFLAHPHFMQREQIHKILEKPFDGIECYYSKCHPEKERRILKIAEKRNLLISGGSDFHGAIRSEISLGCSWVNETIFHQIFEKRL